MRKHRLRKRETSRWKTCASFLTILFLLPYVVSVFIHGADFRVIGQGESTYVMVKHTTAEGDEQITTMPWEEYMMGVLAREMPITYEKEALKAQAVLIRTRLYQTLDAEEEKVLTEPYLTFQEMEKKWKTGNSEENVEKLRRAVEETDDLILKYQDNYAMVPFHQASNGSTRSASEVLGVEDYPYLQCRECPKDKEAEDEMQVTTFEYEQVQVKCQPFLLAVAEEDAEKRISFSDFEILSYDSAGYVLLLRIGETILSGDQFRDALSLASGAFSIKDAGGRLRITTMGRGHGLGLSQWTANAMAKDGKSCEEILNFFFEGAAIEDGGEIFLKIE